MRSLVTVVAITMIAFSIAVDITGDPHKFQTCHDHHVEPAKLACDGYDECFKITQACSTGRDKCSEPPPYCDENGNVKEKECNQSGGIFVSKDHVHMRKDYEDEFEEIKDNYETSPDEQEYRSDICVPYSWICDGIQNLKRELQNFDEDICLNGGKCKQYINGPKIRSECTCSGGYSGKKCETKETTEAPTTTEASTNTKAPKATKAPRAAEPPKCDDEDKKIKNCSVSNYLCPYVECDVCKPCEVPDPKLYNNGDKDFKYYEGCVKKEGCKPKHAIIPLPPNKKCGACGEKKEVDGTGAQEGCRVETCVIKCPNRTTPNSCERISVTKGHPTCPEDCQENVIETITPIVCPDPWHCPMMIPEKDSCNITCVPWKPKGTKRCDGECEKRVAITNKNNKTCEGEMVCKERTCEDINKDKSDGFCYAKDQTECPCSEDETKLVAKLGCDCLKIQCKKIPPPCPTPSEPCEEHEVKVKTKCNTSVLKNSKCKDACENQYQCLCKTEPEDCGEGLDESEVACELNEPEEKISCLKKLCTIERDGKYWRKICIPENCEVCSNMEGATLYKAGWNEKYCHSNEQCCPPKCLDAKVVEACPKSFSDAKKERCKCPTK